MTCIALVVGSPRRESVHRRLAQLASTLTPAEVAVDLIESLDRLPLYNEDLDRPDDLPAEVAALRHRLGGADAVLLFAPANNGTLSAVLKNALDWASRPYGRSSLRDKPIAVVSAAHVTDTVEQHAHLVASIAGAAPVEPSALFALKELDLDDAEVHDALTRTLAALEQAAREVAAA